MTEFPCSPASSAEELQEHFRLRREAVVLTFLLGANGFGKSNFVDAIRFVADSLRGSLDHALRDRGRNKEVRRRSGGHPTHFEIRLDSHWEVGRATLRFASIKSIGGFEWQDENARRLSTTTESLPVRWYDAVDTVPAAAVDRL